MPCHSFTLKSMIYSKVKLVFGMFIECNEIATLIVDRNCENFYIDILKSQKVRMKSLNCIQFYIFSKVKTNIQLTNMCIKYSTIINVINKCANPLTVSINNCTIDLGERTKISFKSKIKQIFLQLEGIKFKSKKNKGLSQKELYYRFQTRLDLFCSKFKLKISIMDKTGMIIICISNN